MPPSVVTAPAAPPRRPLHIRILLGLFIGAVLGLVANGLGAIPMTPGAVDPRDRNENGLHDSLDSLADNFADPVGKVFLRLVFMVVVPLVFTALALGVVAIGDVRKLGRVGLRTLALTLLFSLSAVGIGVMLVNLIGPGRALSADQRNNLRAHYTIDPDAAAVVGKARQAKTIKQTLLDIIPENPLQEMVGALDGSSKGNGMLAVMFFALVMGIALTVLPQERSRTFIAWMEGLFDACMVVIAFAMRLAPYAVACLVFAIAARLGFDILKTLAWFVVTVIVGLALHFFVVYFLAIRLIARRSPIDFTRRISEAIVTAFATSSSNATLPTAMRVARDQLNLPPGIANFVLTVGATGNQNGTGLYEGVVVLFLAQVFGVELTLAQQVLVVMMSVLAGVGTAGVPGGSLPLIVIVLQSVGVPGEGIGIILGVDRILDMSRTVLNVAGDLTVATCVARWEERAAFERLPAQAPVNAEHT